MSTLIEALEDDFKRTTDEKFYVINDSDKTSFLKIHKINRELAETGFLNINTEVIYYYTDQHAYSIWQMPMPKHDNSREHWYASYHPDITDNTLPWDNITPHFDPNMISEEKALNRCVYHWFNELAGENS